MTALREFDVAEITRAVRDACIEINYKLPTEMVVAIKSAREREQSPVGREVLDQLVENA
ncbi:MAG TPA: fumarate hydratase, partial [Acidimicrobiia bacterium]|nr:fumarate hydratase [Acidimicrobiia bacterium]